MSKILDRFKKTINSLKLSFQRFPEVAVISVLIAIIGITLNHQDTFEQSTVETLGKILSTLVIMIPLASYGKLVYEKNSKIKWRIALDLIVIGIGILFYFSIPDDFNVQFTIQFATLFLSFTLIMTLIHFYKKENYSLFVLELISNFFITLLFSLVLFLGITSMLFTVEQLFELSINEELYLDVFISIASLFSITYFFARIPREDEKMELSMYPSVLKGLINYIIIPLITVYTGILYMYFIRIVFLKTFPINLLSHLVMWYGLISVIVLFFINKIKNENRILELFYKIFPIMILLPLGMLFLAIGKRIVDFSVTPLRYYVVVIGVWATFSVLYVKFSKSFKSNIIVIVAVIIMISSLYGPQSAFTLSRNLQENRFVAVLEKNNMIVDGEIISRSEIADSEKEEISDFIRYFSRYHKFSEIEVLPEDFEMNDMKKVFGFEHFYYAYSPRDFINYNFMDRNIVLDISGYDYYLEMDIELEGDQEYSIDDISINYNSDKTLLSFYKNNELSGNINVKEMIESYHVKQGGKQITSLDEATIEYSFDQMNLKFIIGDIYYQKSNSNERGYSHVYLKLLIK